MAYFINYAINSILWYKLFAETKEEEPDQKQDKLIL